MEKHHGFSIADGFRSRTVTGAEFGDREIPGFCGVIRIFFKHGAPVLRTRSPLLLYKVVSQVYSDPFAPVTRFVVNKDPVSPPVVEYFMGIR